MLLVNQVSTKYTIRLGDDLHKLLEYNENRQRLLREIRQFLGPYFRKNMAGFKRVRYFLAACCYGCDNYVLRPLMSLDFLTCCITI
jgi:hypothetical protein